MSSLPVRYDPEGGIDRTIDLPVSYPTCCCFGGENLDRLYVTSASEPLSPAERRAEPFAGRVLALDPGLRGRPEYLTAL
jgi:sugar lactone lactonase YvrE